MNTQNLGVPIAIVIAGAIIAGAIAFSGSSSSGQEGAFGNNNSASATNVRPVDSSDHILGGTDAKVVIIEYSDFECPFCSRYHPTLDKIVKDFGGEVAWVYRHFPLTSIHSRANRAAEASECAAELGGNDAFWNFADELFINQRNLGDELYTSVAVSLGIDPHTFNDCINSGRHADKVQRDLANVIESGGGGTPFSIVINSKGETFPFSGALPYANVRQVVEAALK